MLYTKEARFTDFDEAIQEFFREREIEIIACELCGEYHPPDIHLRPLTPYDPIDPEEA